VTLANQNTGRGYGGSRASKGAHVEGQESGMAGQGRDHALDHVVVVVFENRSLDNLLGACTGRGTARRSRA
jgi:phospholipase C